MCRDPILCRPSFLLVEKKIKAQECRVSSSKKILESFQIFPFRLVVSHHSDRKVKADLLETTRRENETEKYKNVFRDILSTKNTEETVFPSTPN